MITSLASSPRTEKSAAKDTVMNLISTLESTQESNSGTSLTVMVARKLQKLDFFTDQKCCIICYDSLGNNRSKQTVFSNIKHYLAAEAADKLGEEADMKRSQGVSMKGPIQTNSTDCGLFMLQAIEKFLSEDAPDAWVKNFVKTNDYSRWFTPSEAVLRRQALRERVVRTAEQYGIKAHTISPAPSNNSDEEEEEDDLVVLSGPPSPVP